MSTAIAIVIESLGGGGAQHVAVTLANGWSEQGDTVTVITFRDAGGDMMKLAPRVRREVIGGAGDSAHVAAALLANLRRVAALRRMLRKIDADAVISFVGTTNIVAVLAAAGLRGRVIVCERNDPARQSLGPIWDHLRRWLYRRADVVTANSRAALRTMRGFVPDGKLAFVPNPVRQPSDSGAIDRRGRLVVAVGRLHPQKGFDTLLRAFAGFARTRSDWKLAIVGEGGERRALEALVRELRLEGRVSLVGFNDPFAYYRSADIYVQPSRFEGLANSLLEAMSMGCAVIVSDAQEGILEYLRNGESGVLVPVDDPAALAAALARLADDQPLRLALGEAARVAVSGCARDAVLAEWSRLVAMRSHARHAAADD